MLVLSGNIACGTTISTLPVRTVITDPLPRR
jgi:hypothetical protein